MPGGTSVITLPVPITLGNIVGPDSNGVLVGSTTDTDPSKALLKQQAAGLLCITDDGGLYVNETSAMANATGDDVEVLPSTPAVDDAAYFGYAADTFGRIDCNLTTAGTGAWTITWEYWDGDSWETLTVTDGLDGFQSSTGFQSVTFDEPEDWATCTVDSVLAYWIRARVSAYSSVGDAPQIGQGFVFPTTTTYTDDTTDFTDAGTGDVALLPAYPIAGDGFYVGYSEQFCKVKLTISQALSATLTLTPKYWDGSSWTALTTVDDDSSGFSEGTSTYLLHFVPPSDWEANTAANGPGGNTGYFISWDITAFTSMSTQPLGTQGWVLPLTTGAEGIQVDDSGVIDRVKMTAQTVSATNNDSIFLLVNITQTTWDSFTWTGGDNVDEATTSLSVSAGDEIMLIQITEDGTTEFADATFFLTMDES